MFLVTVTNKVRGVKDSVELVDTRFVFDTKEQAEEFKKVREKEGLSATVSEMKQ
jgi:hypothetical protein